MTTPADLGLPPRFATFRSTVNFDQLGVAAEIATSDRRFNLLCAPPGTGKSLIAMTVAALTGWRTLVVVSTKGLQTQWLPDFESIGMRDIRGHSNYPCGVKGKHEPDDITDDPETKCTVRPIDCGFKADVDLAGTARSVITNYAFWLSVGRHVRREILGNFDFLVMDECFPPDTLVDGRRIADIKVGDVVSAFDSNTLAVTSRRVVQCFATPAPPKLVKLIYSGRSVVCTPNHPILTPKGWVAAGLVRVGDSVLCLPHENGQRNIQPSLSTDRRDPVHLVRSPSHHNREPKTLRVQKNWTGILLARLRQSLFIYSKSTKDCGGAGQKFAEDEREQSDAVRGDQSEGQNQSSRSWMETSDSRWEWKTNTRTAAVVGIKTWMGSRVCSAIEKTASWLSNTLQDRYRGANTPSRDRGGRCIAQFAEPKGSRQKEIRSLVVARVDHLEILEQGSDGTFGGLCPDGLVYNLEVEEHHTYLANGLAVHNCHSAPGWLTDYAAVEIWDSELRLAQMIGISAPTEPTIEAWGTWGDRVAGELDNLPNWTSRSEGPRLRRLYSKCVDLGRVLYELTHPDCANCRPTDPWLVVRGEKDRSTRITPTWGRDYAEQYMFRGIPHILGMSATMTRETGDYLGVPREQSTFRELPSPFPLARRPVIYVPTVRVDYRMGDGGIDRLVARVDEVIGSRPGRGIIHTRSYRYAEELEARSKYADRLITHDRGRIGDALHEFKSRPDAVLVTPVVEEGFDFKGELARWQIILKVSVIDSRDPLVKARLAADPKYRYVLVSQSIMQMAGRIVRDIDDWGETLIFDDHWMYLRNDAPWPKWFKDSCRIERVVPRPLMFKPVLRRR